MKNGHPGSAGLRLKKSVFLCFLCLAGNVAAAGFFSGAVEAGVSASAQPDRPWIQLSAGSFFLMQYDFLQNFSAKADISVRADNLLTFFPPVSSDSELRMNAFSLSYTLMSGTFEHKFGIFAGEDTYFGSDTYVRQFFGTESFHSVFAVPKMGIRKNGIYQTDGAGIQYTFKPPVPIAFSIYEYWKAGSAGTSALSTDLRAAGVWRRFLFDIFGGIEVPVGHKAPLSFRAGLTAVAGDTSSDHLYIQAAVVDIKTNEKLSLENMYIVFEPRLTFGLVRLNFSFFSIPSAYAGDMELIVNPIGLNTAVIFADIRWQKLESGINICFSTPYETFAGGADREKILGLQISPFCSVRLGEGILRFCAVISPLKYSDPYEMAQLSVGYKAVL